MLFGDGIAYFEEYVPKTTGPIELGIFGTVVGAITDWGGL